MTSSELPLVDPNSYGAVCAVVDGCLTCGDVAVPVTVVEAGEPDALCSDDHGTRGSVGVELVAPVSVGERLLVHGGVAISRLEHDRVNPAAEGPVASPVGSGRLGDRGTSAAGKS